MTVMRYSYDDWRRKRSCEYKRRFTRAQAQREAAERGDGFRVYRCAFCGHHHVGHKRDEQVANEWRDS